MPDDVRLEAAAYLYDVIDRAAKGIQDARAATLNAHAATSLTRN